MCEVAAAFKMACLHNPRPRHGRRGVYSCGVSLCKRRAVRPPGLSEQAGAGGVSFAFEGELQHRPPFKGALSPQKSALLATGTVFETEHVRGSHQVEPRDLQREDTNWRLHTTVRRLVHAPRQCASIAQQIQPTRSLSMWVSRRERRDCCRSKACLARANPARV